MKRQRGQTVLVLTALVAMGATWGVVSALNSASNRTQSDRGYNARVLAEAKAALIGWVAAQALEATENNPGRLPCPQAWGDIGGAAEGTASGNCSQPAVGWLPWRTLGLPVMRDAAGEQLWYAIAPGWHYVSSTLTINSNTAAGLSLNGQAAVALIIAPGRALNIAPTAAQTAAGCAARSQSHATNLPSTAPNVADYLECSNATSSGYAYTGSVTGNATNAVLNDQIVAITRADLLPALEGAIAKRIERDIVPRLKDVFLGPAWDLPTGVRLFPFAAPFANPGPGIGTSSYAGTAGTYQGLLPFSQVQNCTAGADPRCLPGTALHSFTSAPSAYDAGGNGYIQSISCWWESPNNQARVCEGEYHEDDDTTTNPGMRIEMQITIRNVAMALRMFDSTRMQVEAKNDGTSIWLPQSVTHTKTLNSDGSLTITFGANLPNIEASGWGTYADYRIRIERLVVSDHSLLDPNNATTGWFVRNEWYRLLYYAVAQTHTSESLPGTPSCTTGSNCLRLRTWPSSTIDWDKRVMLVLAGWSLGGAARPNATLSDYVEFQNGDGGTLYEQLPVSTQTVTNRSPSNDRVLTVDKN